LEAEDTQRETNLEVCSDWYNESATSRREKDHLQKKSNVRSETTVGAMNDFVEVNQFKRAFDITK